jgi:hypothetical protein
MEHTTLLSSLPYAKKRGFLFEKLSWGERLGLLRAVLSGGLSPGVRTQLLGRSRVTGRLQYRGKDSISLIPESPPTRLGDDPAIYI